MPNSFSQSIVFVVIQIYINVQTFIRTNFMFVWKYYRQTKNDAIFTWHIFILFKQYRGSMR